MRTVNPKLKSPRAMPNAPTRINGNACEEAPAEEMPFVVEFDVGIVLVAIVEVLCSRDPKLELGGVIVESVEARIGDMETIVPRGTDIGASIGVDVIGSNIVRVTVMSEPDIATATDVGIMLVLGTAGAEEGIVNGGKVGVLVGWSTEPILLALVG
jgi:hypothetical protein